MERIGYPDMVVSHVAYFGGHHEGEDPRQICLVSECHHVEHKIETVVQGWSAWGNVWQIELGQIVLFHFLNAALDLPDAFEIVAEHRSVLRVEFALEIAGLFGDQVEN